MTISQIRAAAPVGRDVTVQLTDGPSILVTVLLYDAVGMIAGSHPDLLAIPYGRISGIIR